MRWRVLAVIESRPERAYMETVRCMLGELQLLLLGPTVARCITPICSVHLACSDDCWAQPAASTFIISQSDRAVRVSVWSLSPPSLALKF